MAILAADADFSKNPIVVLGRMQPSTGSTLSQKRSTALRPRTMPRS